MFKNHILITLRTLKKYKIYSTINILGLAVGMACFLFIALYIVNELSYERHHANADRIYRLEAVLTLGGKPNPVASTNFPPTLAMRNDYPEVANSVRFVPRRKVLVENGSRKYYEERIYYAEETVFDIFTFPLVSGDPKTALEAANTIVITESMARRYFGGEDPVGKALKLNSIEEFMVTGVMKDIPRTSHMVFDALLSFKTFRDQRPAVVDSWTSYFGSYGYVLLAPGADHLALEGKLPAMLEKYVGNAFREVGNDVEYTLTPIKDIHLHSHKRHEIEGNSDISYIYIFGAVAVFILLIACINFMNLSTARSSTRAKEIGIRKVLGARRGEIVRQFFGEAVFYSLASLILALVMTRLTLPWMNALSDRELGLSFSKMPWLVPALAVLSVLAGLIAGSYPALLLSRFKPARVLKGVAYAGGSGFRKTLVVVQFAISILLIISTLCIMRQLEFMKSSELGFDEEQVVVIPIMERSIIRKMEAIKDELKSYTGVLAVAASSHVPGGITSGGSFVPEGYPDGTSQMMNAQNIDDDYLSTLGIGIAAGRNFSSDFPADTAFSVIINETAAKVIGWDDPVGKTIQYARDPERTNLTVVGVVKDFHYTSLHMEIEPLFMTRAPDFLRNVFVKIAPDDVRGTLDYLRSKWAEYDPDRPFEFYFLDESFGMQYRSEEKLQGIFFNFTILAIFIACLGLFGLASFAAERRTKEIGVRKVFGASASSIVLLLSKEFARWVLLANIIAWPLAWLGIRKWLDNFAYRTDIAWYIFIISGLAALALALITVSWQAIRASQTNPADTLKYE